MESAAASSEQKQSTKVSATTYMQSGEVCGQSPMTEASLLAWEHRLQVREEMLLQREKLVLQRETSLFQPLPPTVRHHRTQCDHCDRTCNRDSACYFPDGSLQHRHHTCQICHTAMKEAKGRKKGSGREKR